MALWANIEINVIILYFNKFAEKFVLASYTLQGSLNRSEHIHQHMGRMIYHKLLILKKKNEKLLI